MVAQRNSVGFLPDAIATYKRRHPSAGLLAYRRAVCLHKLYVAAAREAERAAHEAEQALLRQKRSYWERLNGYEFERATAEALKQHQFNPKVTGGSADGGVDVEVARGGHKGVVQCKAHVACVAPHTVRDLFGVMHHSGADFGIIVSRGGFTKGARDFARSKPIFLVDTFGLIAMQEGQDVLAGGFLTT
jgi:HJR/Mrr/RecB family endonuclease